MTKSFKYIIGIFSISFFSLGCFDSGPMYDKQDLIDNYEQNKNEILEVKNFIESKISSDNYIDIELQNIEGGLMDEILGRNKLQYFHIEADDKYENNWNVDIDSKKTDTLLAKINWTRDDLRILRTKLKKANCISISNNKPITIGWQRSGMGKYFYRIFNFTPNDSIKNRFNNGCTQSYYKDNVVLEFGGGAFGIQCFRDYKKE